MAKGPLFRRSSSSSSSNECNHAEQDDDTVSYDVLSEWHREIENHSLAAFDLGGALDVLLEVVPLIELPTSLFLPTLSDIHDPIASQLEFHRHSISSLPTSSSSQVITDDNASVEDINPPSHPTASDRRVMDELQIDLPGVQVTIGRQNDQFAAASMPSEKDTARNAEWCSRTGRPVGKFPLFPEGRCEHHDHWIRVRARRVYNYMMCKYCGLGWCSARIYRDTSDPVSETEAPAVPLSEETSSAATA